jgi:hypothetical protein
VDHFNKSISSGIKKRKLAIISQTGTGLFNSLPEKNKMAYHTFIIAFTIAANTYPSITVVATTSPSGGLGIHWIMSASKKQILQMNATFEKNRILNMI